MESRDEQNLFRCLTNLGSPLLNLAVERIYCSTKYRAVLVRKSLLNISIIIIGMIDIIDENLFCPLNVSQINKDHTLLGPPGLANPHLPIIIIWN